MSRVTFQRNPAGWRQLERSSELGNAMQEVADGIAAAANQGSSSRYETRQVSDPGGLANTPRAAAEVYTDSSTTEDAMQRRLLSVSYAYRVRGMGADG